MAILTIDLARYETNLLIAGNAACGSTCIASVVLVNVYALSYGDNAYNLSSQLLLIITRDRHPHLALQARVTRIRITHGLGTSADARFVGH